MKTFGHAGTEPTNMTLPQPNLGHHHCRCLSSLHPEQPASLVDLLPTQMPCVSRPPECIKGNINFKTTPSRGETTQKRRRRPIPRDLGFHPKT
jgi:hypothetical protein